jgi:hypothetical protein
MAQDPVHFADGSWWFWNETWSERHGPFASVALAHAALNRYAREALEGLPPDPEEERI